MPRTRGYLALILHAHLPFVRHPEHPFFLEEDWLYEAITECYIPLLHVFEGLVRDGVPWKLTMSMTPTLTTMLRDELLQERYVRHVDKLISLAEKEVDRTAHEPAFQRLARAYLDEFRRARHTFEEVYGRDLVAAFARFQASGHLEIIASAATHGYFPLMEPNPQAVWAQIAVGVEAYRRNFGRDPAGFWLPECGYNPPDDELLARAGLRYFIAESHGLLHARPRPRYATFAPVYCPDSGVAVFARDLESSKQVWSATEGYPGDGAYRDFYRDIGFDLDYDYVRPWLKGDVRSHVGIKYYRITGETKHKQPYDPPAARERAAVHAGNFMFNRGQQIEHLAAHMDQPPLIVSPYDAELFGHWWYEGPQWLDFLIRKIAFDQNVFELTTPSAYLSRFPRHQVARPSGSSWGYKGYNEVWLGASNDWIYRHLHAAVDTMVSLADTFSAPDALTTRALNQAARELLLAQASDWAFIMKTGTMVEYAVKRTHDHLGRFWLLHDELRAGRVDATRLAGLEAVDNIFPWIDYRVFRTDYARPDAVSADTSAAAVPVSAYRSTP